MENVNTSENFNFELMAIQKEEQNISSDTAMLYLLSANSCICNGKERIETEKGSVRLGNGTIVSVHSILNSSTPLNDRYFGVFNIMVHGKQECVEDIRIPIVKYLMLNQFTVFVVNDEVSQELAKQLYPLINQVETALRSYLIKYFIKMFSTDFWKKIADKDMQAKLDNTEKNLSSLRNDLGIPKNIKLSDSNLKLDMYGIEFRQLGRIIFGDRLGTVSSLDDAIKLIKNADDLAILKNEVFTFGDKFFKDSFLDKGFQEKWEALTKIRHLVAHNNILMKEDYELGIGLSREILSIIKDAQIQIDNSTTKLYNNISIGKAEDEIEKPIIFMNESYKIISQSELLKELQFSENFSKNSEGYVGQKWFVETILKNKNYAIGPSYDVIQALVAKNRIEVFDYFDSHLGYVVKAVKTILPTE